MICDFCEEEKEDVELLLDPYLDEIYDEKEYCFICKECYIKRSNDI